MVWCVLRCCWKLWVGHWRIVDRSIVNCDIANRDVSNCRPAKSWMRQLFLPVVFLVVLLTDFACAYGIDIGRLDKVKVIEGKLSNGLDVYVMPYRFAPVVLHAMVVRIGSAGDYCGKGGIAHFAEHLMFKGIHSNVADTVYGMGGKLNAFTSYNVTSYYELVPKDDLEAVMTLDAKRMREGISGVDSDAFEAEKKVIIEERRFRYENDERDSLYDLLESVLYRDSVRGQPIIGWNNSIKDISLEDTKRFVNQFYRPENSFVLVIGDVDFNDVMSLAKKHYSNIDRGGDNNHVLDKRVASGEQALNGLTLTLHTQHTKDQWVRLYRVDKDYTFNDLLSWSMLMDILGNGNNSKLYQYFVKHKKLASSVVVDSDHGFDCSKIDGYGSADSPTVLHGEFGSNLSLTALMGNIMYNSTARIIITPKVGVAMDEITNEFDNFMKNLLPRQISPKDLDVHKALAKARFLYTKSDAMASLRMLIFGFFANKFSVDKVNNMDAEIDLVKISDVLDMAKDLVDSYHVNAYLYGDKGVR